MFIIVVPYRIQLNWDPMDELHYDPIDTTVSLIANIVSLKSILPDDDIVMMLTKIYKNSPIKHIIL
jgi:hypothetical protein